jgi:hypothetical protein
MQDSANFSTVWRAESFSVSKHEQARIEWVLRDKFEAAVCWLRSVTLINV